MKTIGDMQNEKYFYYHDKMFVNNHDFLKFFGKIIYDTLEYEVINNNV